MNNQTPQGTFALSLAAGVLMLLGGGLSYMWFGSLGFGGMMGGLGLIGLISGAAVTMAAPLLKSRPKEHASWGR